MKLKNIIKATVGVAAAAALALTLVGCGGSGSGNSGDQQKPAELSGTISTNGSTSMEKVIGSLSEAFMADNSGVTVTYDATGSGTGIECASNGSADLGLASRDLKPEETGLKTVTVALDGIAVVVNENCGVDDLSLEQIAKIFTGKIKNWSELGGADKEIACIGRENGSGTEDACKLAQELTSTGAVLTAVASSENAIGYASLSAVEGQAGIKSLTVDGVACSEETVLDGSYKIQRPFNIVISGSQQPSDLVQAFIDFCTSADAADLIRSAGAVPLA